MHRWSSSQWAVTVKMKAKTMSSCCYSNITGHSQECHAQWTALLYMGCPPSPLKLPLNTQWWAPWKNMTLGHIKIFITLTTSHPINPNIFKPHPARSPMNHYKHTQYFLNESETSFALLLFKYVHCHLSRSFVVRGGMLGLCWQMIFGGVWLYVTQSIPAG